MQTEEDLYKEFLKQEYALHQKHLKQMKVVNQVTLMFFVGLIALASLINISEK